MPIDRQEPRRYPLAAEAGYCAPYLYLLHEPEAPARTPSHYTRKKLSEVTAAIKGGRGQGRGDCFQPWIRIRRNFSSPVSYQVFDHSSIHPRNHHFLSQLEFHTALILAWVGAHELRECLPVWPVDHLHPAAELDGRFVAGRRSDEIVPGLLQIAQAAGIEHGCFVGTSVPYIASLDIMIGRQTATTARFLGVSCKPRTILKESPRARERIELERLYCKALGARHVCEGGEAFDRTLLNNLNWLRPHAAEVRMYRDTAQLRDFAGYFSAIAQEVPADVARQSAGRRANVSPERLSLFFRLSLWLHLVDVDLTRRIYITKPLRAGGSVLRRRLREHYWGASDE